MEIKFLGGGSLSTASFVMNLAKETDILWGALRVKTEVSEIQALSSRLEVQNSHMSADLKQCENNRSETIAETAKQLDLKQKAHDDKVEKLLTEQGRLRDQKKLLEDSLNLKDRELMMCQQKNPVPFKPVFQKPGGFQSPPQTNLPSPGASGIGKR